MEVERGKGRRWDLKTVRWGRKNDARQDEETRKHQKESDYVFFKL